MDGRIHLFGRSEPGHPMLQTCSGFNKMIDLCIQWICGVGSRDKVPSATLLLKLGIKEVLLALLPQCLRWFGHVQHALSCTNTISDIAIPGARGAGRLRKTWSECVKNDRKECFLSNIDPHDRDVWRACVRLA